MKSDSELELLERLLRQQPPCTAADVSHFAIAFWDGQSLMWSRLGEDGSAQVDGRFAVDLDAWDELCGYVDDWLAAPTFSSRPELRCWIRAK